MIGNIVLLIHGTSQEGIGGAQLLKTSGHRGHHGSQVHWRDTLLRSYDVYEDIAASWELIDGHGDEATASKEPWQSDQIFIGVAWDPIVTPGGSLAL